MNQKLIRVFVMTLSFSQMRLTCSFFRSSILNHSKSTLLGSSRKSLASRTFETVRTKSDEDTAKVVSYGVPYVTIFKGKARLFWDGNPLVFGGAVSSVTGNPKQGDIIDVKSDTGKLIGWGVFNESSMFRVRILAFATESLAQCRDIAKVIEDRCNTAIELRAAIGLPSAETTAYRCINGEGDRLSGIVIDIFDKSVCVSSSALWVEIHRSTIEGALNRVFGPEYNIVWRLSDGRLQQDGWVNPLPKSNDGSITDDVKIDSNSCSSVEILESSIKYLVQPYVGQKTGFYCDQRENRLLLRSLSRGKTVLDMFCYSGGFALNAAKGGAIATTAVDSSQNAIDSGIANAAMNNISVDFEKGEAIEWMKSAISKGATYDIVVIDPPKLAPNKKALPRAITMYTRLNSLAIKLVTKGGLLMTYSCSAAMLQSGGFVDMVQVASTKSNRPITLIRSLGPSSDHTLNPSYPEGAYLTGGLFFCP